MKKFALMCENRHEFEGWFSDAAAVRVQADNGLIDCPFCGSLQVQKQLSAPNLSTPKTHARINKARIDKEAAENIALIERLMPHLDANKPAITLEMSEDDQLVLKRLCLLSAKRVLFACNVAEDDLADPSQNTFVRQVEQYAREHHGAGTCVISASVEAELIDFDATEAAEYLQSLGVADSGVSRLIRATYDLLGLASYFTAGVQEVRAWTFKQGMKAPQCAGVIHTDFESGFIKAEVVAYSDLITAGSTAGAREAGKYRLEGKDYEFKDGDVALFRFNN